MNVFLLAPNFETLGGFEAQFSALAMALVEHHVQVSVFIREPVRSDHPYWIRMRRAGVQLYAPTTRLAHWLSPPLARRQAILGVLLALFSPLLFPVTVADALLRRRPWHRSWPGGIGRLRAWLGKWVYFDGLTWWMESEIDRALRHGRPDLIDVHHSMLPSGIVYGKRRGLPTIYTEHGAPSAELWSVWAGLCPIINQADFIIGRSEASLEGLRRLCGADRPTATVPQAVTDGPATADEAGLEAADNREVVITAVGRLSPEKGPQYLLEAFKLMSDEGLPVRLMLAGDGPLRETLRARAAAWGLQHKVEFTGAFDDLAPIMRATHIVAHPTLNDGRSVSVLEAMAWGRPVVASRTGGLPELIEDQVSGLLAPPGDPAALAGALKRLVLDPESRRRMGSAARLRFLEGQFSPENMVTKTLAIYRQVAQRQAGNCAST